MNNTNEHWQREALAKAFSLLIMLKKYGNALDLANAGASNDKKELLPWRLREPIQLLSKAKRSLRESCYLLLNSDALEEREMATKKRFNTISGNKIFYFTGLNGTDRIDYHPDHYWLDDFMNAYRSGNRTLLHDKNYYYRVGNNFYSKGDYLLKDGQVYSKDKYALTNSGELVELSKCIKLGANYHNYYRGTKFEASDWLKCPDEEEFECVQCDEDKYAVRVFCYENDRSSKHSGIRLLDINYYLTLFRFGKKRFFYRKSENMATFNFTPKMLIDFEYAPTKEHERCWKYFFEEVAKFKNKHGLDCLPKMKEDGKDVCFFIEYNRGAIKTSSIRDKIIKSLCDYNNDNRLSLGELLNRLDTLKAIYKTEMKYESGTKQDD